MTDAGEEDSAGDLSPRSGGAPIRWAALVGGNAVLGVVASVALVLWLAVLDGLAQRSGWVRQDPTMFRDGFTPWLVAAAAATAVDLALVLPLNALLRRWPGSPAGPRRAVAIAAHLGVGTVLALLWARGLPSQ